MSKCDDCGTELIYRCVMCGAPVCCPKCCEETTKQGEEFTASETAAKVTFKKE